MKIGELVSLHNFNTNIITKLVQTIDNLYFFDVNETRKRVAMQNYMLD